LTRNAPLPVLIFDNLFLDDLFFFWTAQHVSFSFSWLSPFVFLGICMNGVYFWTAQLSLSLCLFALFVLGICMNGVCIEYGFI